MRLDWEIFVNLEFYYTLFDTRIINSVDVEFGADFLVLHLGDILFMSENEMEN
jgi:hypothetical protein